jgi:hypothetical protein
MFIIPSIEVLLLSTAVVLALGALQWFIGGMCLRNPRVQRSEGGRGNASEFDHAA